MKSDISLIKLFPFDFSCYLTFARRFSTFHETVAREKRIGFHRNAVQMKVSITLLAGGLFLQQLTNKVKQKKKRYFCRRTFDWSSYCIARSIYSFISFNSWTCRKVNKQRIILRNLWSSFKCFLISLAHFLRHRLKRRNKSQTRNGNFFNHSTSQGRSTRSLHRNVFRFTCSDLC